MMASDRPAPDSPATRVAPVSAAASTPPATPAAAGPGVAAPSAFLQGLDVFQAAGVVLLGFLLASFAVRNSDFYQNLAAGRLIAQGDYTPGVDPFCYTTEGQTWVNHPWLFQWAIYQIHERFGPAALVILKAVCVALLAAILLLTRKPTGSHLGFGVASVGMMLLAIAPRLVLQPMVLSMLFLGVLYFLITHCSGRNDRLRLSVAVGVLFCLWANCDAWFILGPITLGLFTLGEYLMGLLRPSLVRDGADEPGDPANVIRPGRFQVKTLLTALGVGVLACMAHPQHVHVWQVPDLYDSQASEVVAGDGELSTLFAPLGNPNFFNLTGSSRVANPVNAFALVGLALLTAVGLGWNLLSQRFSHWLLLAFFTVIGLQRYRLMPFLAITWVVLAQWYLGVATARLGARVWSAPTLSLLRLPRVGLRLVSLVCGVALILSVRPGWLNQEPNDPLRARWLTWGVQEDESASVGARALQRLRDEGKLPPDARGLVLQTDFAYLLNWYAPGEKTFADFRYSIHGEHLGDFKFLRDWSRGQVPAQEIGRVPQLLEKYRITHLILASTNRADNFELAANQLIGRNPFLQAWTPWLLEGRVWVLGYNGQKSLPREKLAGLKLDPVKRAFSADAKPVDEPREVRPYGRPGFIEAYWDIPPPTPASVEHSYSYFAMQQILRDQANLRYRGTIELGQALTSGPVFAAMAMTQPPEGYYERGPLDATALESIRAARAATVANPDSPDAFFSLARAYNIKFPTLPEMAELMVVANLQRGLHRVQPEVASDATRFEAFSALIQLAEMYRSGSAGPRLDSLTDLIKQAEAYRELRIGAIPRDRREQAIDGLKRPFEFDGQEGPTPQSALEQVQNRFELALQGVDEPLTRALIARTMGLHREGREILAAINAAEGEAANRPERAIYEIDMAEAELTCGFPEEAYQHLQQAERLFGDRLNTPEFQRAYQTIRLGMAQQVQQRLRVRANVEVNFAQSLQQLKVRTCFVLGKFTEAIAEDQRLLMDLERELAGKLPADLLEKVRRLPDAERLNFFDALTRNSLESQPMPVNLIGAEYLRRLRGETFSKTVGEAQLLEGIHFLHVRVALMNLERGDNREAKFHFEQSLRPGGISFPCRYSALAREYLKVLE